MIELGLQLKFVSIQNIFICLIFLISSGASQATASEPCIKGQDICTEWVTLDANGSRARIYRTHALSSNHEKIEHAVIVIHGQGRNADGYFRHMLAAAFLADALQNTIVISPRFASHNGKSCLDQLDTQEVGWICSGADSWRSGGNQVKVAEPTLNSFDFMDAIISKLADVKAFPSLRSIVIAGHSAGGQYVNRYQFSNRMHEKVMADRNIQISYVIVNPSSYTYPDALRPTRAALPIHIAADSPGYMLFAKPGTETAFVVFNDRKNCTAFNHWPYGLENKVGFAKSIPDEQLKRQLSSRSASYLLGELDILPLYGFDDSCPAMAQGPTRLARGFAYAKFVSESLKANHKAMMVPACGHDARCMFTSETALPVLFKSVR